MKNLAFLLVISCFMFSCVEKDPKLDESKYITMQQEYEAQKLEITSAKTSFFEDKQEALASKLALFKKVKDSNTTFTNVSKDTTFYLKGAAIKMVNFPTFIGPNYVPRRARNSANTATDQKTGIFIAKQGNTFSEETFREYYTELYNCKDKNITNDCTDLKVTELQHFLDLDYAFIVSGHKVMEPSLEDSKNFSPGIFLATITAYDLNSDKAILDFSVVATNSEEVSYREGGFINSNPTEVVQNDFRKNIQKALWEGCQKHFNL